MSNVSAHALPKLLSDAVDLGVIVRRAMRTAYTRIREATCAIGGHDYMLRASGNRIFLRCADCGHETPGWRIDVVARRPTRSARAASQR